MTLPIVARLHRALERTFPEQRLFLRSDTETRFIRLSPLTQFVGLSGSAMLLGWTIVSSAILLMHSLGAGDVRDGGAFLDRMGSVVCWNSVMDENQYMVRKWNEFIAA